MSCVYLSVCDLKSEYLLVKTMSSVSNHKYIWSPGYCVRSNDDLSLTFTAMFPELKKTFNMTRMKSIYAINHGRTPYFWSSIDRSDICSFSFDESLNGATQTSEMDLYVRFRNVNENKVNIRYYRSSFLAHGTHQNLLSYFSYITKDLDHSHLHKISMDSPNANIKFHQEFSAHFKERNFNFFLLTLTFVLYTSSKEVLPLQQKNLDTNYKRFWKEHITFFTTFLLRERGLRKPNWF